MAFSGPNHPLSSYFISQGLFEKINCFKELEDRISSLGVTRRGDAFEVFTEAYLSTQPIFQAKEVWPINALPTQLRKKLSLLSTDQGIDGVYINLLGELVAYQAKFRSQRRTLTWTECATFVGLSDMADHRLIVTNAGDVPRVMKSRDKLFSVRGFDLDKLTIQEFQILLEWLKSSCKKKAFKVTRNDHQKEAVKSILTELKTNSRTTVLAAPGTGKTLIALWACEDYLSMNRGKTH